MAQTIVEIVPYFGQPGTGNTSIFTVPANHNYIVTTITLANTSGSAATIDIARNGTSATAANRFVGTVSIPANTTEILTGPFNFVAGDNCQARQGTSGAITMYMSGADHTLT